MFEKISLTAMGSIAAMSLLAACSGGGASAPSAQSGTSSSRMGVTLLGKSSSFATTRHILDAYGTPILVTYNGATVATGSLDRNGFAELTFTSAVPEGATVLATIGSAPNAIVASIKMASAIPATSAELIYNPGPPPTILVKSGEDQAGDGHYMAGEAEEDDEYENAQNGNHIASASPSPSPLPSAPPNV
jgi:hypothetical protein